MVTKTYHRGEHTPIAPHVETIIILLEVYQQLWALKITRRHTDIVLCFWMVKLGQSPVDQAQLRLISTSDREMAQIALTFLRSWSIMTL